MLKHFDLSTLIIILTTLVLFVAALFTKGFTHELLLESAVFLVSVKLILLAYSNKQNQLTMMREFEDIKAFLEEAKNSLNQQKQKEI